MNRLHLLFPHVTLGGGETATMALADRLSHDFDLAVGAFDNLPSEPGPTIRDELRQRFGEVTFLSHRWQLRPFLEKADVLLWYGVVPQVPKALAALGRRPLSIRVVHTDRPVDGAIFARRWQRAIDAVVAVSPAVARSIPGAVFIPNTCSASHLSGPRRRLFPAGPEPVLGFLGRLAPLKNAGWLVDHAAELGYRLAVQALDTPLSSVADLERRAGRRGLAQRVCFLPPSRDVGTLLRSVDALAVVSRHEGFPRVVVEAGLLGVPVLATRVGALPELFADEILFVESRGSLPDPHSFSAALEGIDSRLGELLRHKVERLCAPDVVAGRYTELIRGLLERTPVRASASGLLS